jgi:hypothetical protein
MILPDPDFRAEATRRYDAANRETLGWMLSRPPLKGGFLDTKVNPLTGADYGAGDGLRGPDWTYGWIQGRGLEALATFARHYRDADPALADRLIARMRPLYGRLVALTEGGHAYFLYDADMRPVRPEGALVVPQENPRDIFTFADAFAAKGLVAASALIDPAAVQGHLAYLLRVIDAIEAGRFQIDEKARLGEVAIAAQPDDFGPRMILLGAAGMLRRSGQEVGPWADRFIEHVLSRHFDAEKDILRNIPGEDAFNAGHGIEFTGFAFDHLSPDCDPDLRDRLALILRRSLDLAFLGPGVVLSLSLASGQPLVPRWPWWTQPETIRACALALARGAGPGLLEWWQRADTAFFGSFWQAGRGYAHQTLGPDGPVDFVPATPDLDPGYHTGLSLLAAATAGTGD